MKKTPLALFIGMAFALEGWWTLTAVKLDGTSRQLAHFPNLITDIGLNQMGAGAFMTHCRVGTGSTPPANNNTALVAQVASTSTQQSNTRGTSSEAPYYGWNRRRFRFDIGAAAGNLTEIGIGWSSSGSSLYSRSLIKDEEGEPTTVTVLPDEFLDASYELRSYAPEADSDEIEVTIGGVPYAFIVRPSVVTTQEYWAPYDGIVSIIQPFGSNFGLRVYNGSLGAVTSSPTGTSAEPSGISSAAYTTDSHYRDFTISYGLDYGNVPGGITALGVSTSFGTYQMSCDPPIPKDNTKLFSITHRLSWARRT